MTIRIAHPDLRSPLQAISAEGGENALLKRKEEMRR